MDVAYVVAAVLSLIVLYWHVATLNAIRRSQIETATAARQLRDAAVAIQHELRDNGAGARKSLKRIADGVERVAEAQQS